MGNRDVQRKYSLRKYKGVGLASAVIGLFFANGTVVSAAVSSNGTDTATVVSDTSKVSSTSATTFTDDTNSKTVKVDAVLGKDVAEPTKANHNTGDVDGNDTVNFKTEATVNYKLESDKSLLKTETVEGEKGTVTTPYDKKGIAYDTDGKDYRESTVAKTGNAVTEATGKKETVEANNKVYEYVRSEVEGADKATYDKTNFNNIEARVSPEGMHNKLGEIDYTKTTGKVYLVEETANGQYGKFVEANGVTSDEDAVAKWKAGQAEAKDFTKENVTLQEGDTILVMDKDTYAVGKAGKIHHKKKYQNGSYEVAIGTDDYNNLEETTVVEENGYALDYEIGALTYELDTPYDITAPGEDGIFGTADDKVDTSKTIGLVKYSFSDITVNDQNDITVTPNLVVKLKENDTVADGLKKYLSAQYKALDMMKNFSTDSAEKEKIAEARSKLDQYVTNVATKLVKNNEVFLTPEKELVLRNDSEVLDNLNTDLAGIFNNLKASGEKKTTTEQISPDKVSSYPTKYRPFNTIIKTTHTEYDFTGVNITKWSKTKEERNSVFTTDEVSREGSDTSRGTDYWVTTKNEDKQKALATSGNVTIGENNKISILGDLPNSDYWDTTVYARGGNDVENRIKLEYDREKWNGYPIFTKEAIAKKFTISNGLFFDVEKDTDQDYTDYTTKEVITPIRAYKVMSEAKPVVTHYYNVKITKEEAGEATASKQGSVVIKYVTTDGKQLKSETDKDNVTLETKTIVSLYSGETKVGERTDVATVEQNYDTTPKQYPTLVDADTGFTYEYVGLKQGSPAASGKVVEGTTEVVYEYRLVSEEEKTPSKSDVTKTGSVDVKHVVINEDGSIKTLRETEIVKENVPLEYEDTYVTYSKGVKVSERKEKRTVITKYDTTDKQYPTLKDEVTGLVYKYVAPTDDSADVVGTVTEGEKHVVYRYILDKQEETTPSKVVDTKGSVVVKFVDANGNEIKDAENVVTDAVVKTTKTYATKSGDVVLSTRDKVEEHTVAYDTQTAKVQTITKDGKKYSFYRVLPVDTKFNNVTEETGSVKEGVTTIVYQYDYIIPVDPTKPNEGDNTPPKPEDKIPNDPQNRSYKDLGLLKEVKRNITYVYENGPKAGQEASTPVNQNARFTRTAEINSRTGEVTYTTEWTPVQKLAEVVSPKITKYSVDKEKVAELSVTHESEDSSEVVKYRENPDVIEHDADKDKKGTVIVKYVDEQGNEIDTPVTVKNNVIVEKATTKIYADRDAETTYTETNESYNTMINRKVTIEFNGKKYIYQRVLPVSTTLGNSDKEMGKVPEGTTTVIYQYAEEVDPFIPPFPPTVEVPEFNGKVDDAEKDKKGTVIVKFVDINENTLAADVIAKDNVVVEKASTTITGDKAETTYTATGEKYTVTAPQTIEVDGVTFRLKRVLPASDKFNNTVEEKGLVKEGVTTIVYQYVMQVDAPKVEVPEFKGGATPLDPPTVDKPEYEGGVVPLDPPVVEIPELKIPEEPKSTPEPKPEPMPEPKSNPQPKPEEPKKDEPKQNDSIPGNTNKVNETPSSVQENTLKELPNTGTGQEVAIFGAAISAVLAGLGLSLPSKKED